MPNSFVMYSIYRQLLRCTRLHREPPTLLSQKEHRNGHPRDVIMVPILGLEEKDIDRRDWEADAVLAQEA